MTWEKEIEELRARERLAYEMGGPEKIQRQRDAGRLTVRERITALLDENSFHELGATAGFARYDEHGNMVAFQPGNFVFGRGKIERRPVVVGGDDFTVRGGASDAAISQKQIAAEQMANELRLPIVRLIEGTGGGGSVKSLENAGFTYIPANPGWNWVVDNLNAVPVVSLGLGPVAGLGAARMVTSHYSLLVENISQMFVAGPPVVAAIGEKLTKEELGGSRIHAQIGAVDDQVASEQEAFQYTRRFLSYLPSSVFDLPPRGKPQNDSQRREEFLIDAVPRDRRHVYKMRPIVEAVVDKGSFFEIGKLHGRSIITGFARLDGWPVAIVASDPFVLGGIWTASSSMKLERFVSLAETFHLPVVHFVDIPGFAIGRQAEKEGTIRVGARALAALYQATIPWCTIIIRKAFGVAGAGNQNHTRFHYRYAWPSADWGSLPIEGGIEAAYKSDLATSENPAQLLEDIKDRLNRVRSPFRTAEKFGIEEIIDPRDTRPLLCEFANLAAPLRAVGPPRALYRP
ncbi:MAG TPA: carboxyl transferase domain-containing protein [Steroidobacteraceae bacterium]|nr:carboxyl transferase domain-containing protein [Steroidobacteraceae bacterium]